MCTQCPLPQAKQAVPETPILRVVLVDARHDRFEYDFFGSEIVEISVDSGPFQGGVHKEGRLSVDRPTGRDRLVRFRVREADTIKELSVMVTVPAADSGLSFASMTPTPKPTYEFNVEYLKDLNTSMVDDLSKEFRKAIVSKYDFGGPVKRYRHGYFTSVL